MNAIQPSIPYCYSKYHSGNWETVEGGVIVEKTVSLTVNGKVWITFMCTPDYLEALAVGFLFNENIIQSIEEVASIHICESGDNVDVWLSRYVEKPESWVRTSGCTGGITISEAGQILPVADYDYKLAPSSVSRLVDKLLSSQELYKEVGGVHTSALSDGEDIIIKCDDIGRHNTLDKLAGRCLIEGISPPWRILITTGRISSEMIQKAARLNAVIVISRTSPSSLSIERADKHGITLIGYARRESLIVYTHPKRISEAPAC